MTAEEQVQADIDRMRQEREASEPKPVPPSTPVKESAGSMIEGVKALLRMGHKRPGGASESGMSEQAKQLRQLEKE